MINLFDDEFKNNYDNKYYVINTYNIKKYIYIIFVILNILIYIFIYNDYSNNLYK